jgi:hypothetical protein
MKKLSLILGIILLVINAAVCYFLTAAGQNALIVSSLVIATTFLLLFTVHSVSMKDAFKTSLSFLFVCGGIIEYILSFFIRDEVKQNGFLLAIIILFVIQLLFLIICASHGKQGQ